MKIAPLTVAPTIAELRSCLSEVRNRKSTVGFVPTMGALHAGHGELIRRASSENNFVVVSIFVNPLQFDRKSDLDAYPREMERDVETCARLGADLIYAPWVDDLYPQPQLAFAQVPALEEHLCGRYRPGHFRGVATVVLKLLNIVQPARAYFGEKDAQQLAIIRRMVDDLNVPVEIVPVGTVREPDGLAMSSRNVRLTAEQRRIAPWLYSSLREAAELLSSGETSIQTVRNKSIAALLSESSLRLEYYELCDPRTLTPLQQVADAVLIAGAIFLGDVRLIDNLTWSKS